MLPRWYDLVEHFCVCSLKHQRSPNKPDHFARLNTQCRADIAWWSLFLHHWNGRSYMPSEEITATSTSDASGSWGCGAIASNHHWFQLKWPSTWSNSNIASKEMVPVVISAAIWGIHWHGQHILFRCDNESVVSVINTRNAKDRQLVHLSCCLFFFAAAHHFTFCAEHIAGKANGAADALSRNHLDIFLSLVPQASPKPSIIPQALIALVLDQPVEWTSPGSSSGILWMWYCRINHKDLQLRKEKIYRVLHTVWLDPLPCIRGGTLSLRIIPC